MGATVTIRDLRNRFPRVREMLEREGEVVVTDQGEPRYRITPYDAAVEAPAPPAKDYLARLRRHQPRPLGMRRAGSLHDANRGDR